MPRIHTAPDHPRTPSRLPQAPVGLAGLLAGVLTVLMAAPVLPAAAESARPGTTGPDRLVGTPGRDLLRGRGGDDRILGLGGADYLAGGRSADRVRGGRGGDELYGGPGEDRIRGGVGRDVLLGDAGPDVLLGGPGADFLADGDATIRGGAGRDRAVLYVLDDPAAPPVDLHLGAGRDEVIVQPDGFPDLIDCGPGRDAAYVVDRIDPADTYVSCESIGPYEGA